MYNKQIEYNNRKGCVFIKKTITTLCLSCFLLSIIFPIARALHMENMPYLPAEDAVQYQSEPAPSPEPPTSPSTSTVVTHTETVIVPEEDETVEEVKEAITQVVVVEEDVKEGTVLLQIDMNDYVPSNFDKQAVSLIFTSDSEDDKPYQADLSYHNSYTWAGTLTEGVYTFV